MKVKRSRWRWKEAERLLGVRGKSRDIEGVPEREKSRRASRWGQQRPKEQDPKRQADEEKDSRGK
eukprot:1316253-Amorphochlora_amoeboformis.AAC.2